MSLRSLAVLALALAGSPALADFDSLSAAAQRLDTLETFLAGYVGKCTDIYERQTCEANVAAARRAAAGKTFSVRVSNATQLVHPQRKGGAYVLLLTPFVDGGGLALTHGQPSGQDAAGNPRIALIPINSPLPPGMMEMDFERPFRTGSIELEIIFRPERTWKLPRRGESGSMDGVAARFLGVQVIDARSGQVIATRLL
ncbi:MAG: DUF6066 family protein [Anaeromyxobacter sp.]